MIAQETIDEILDASDIVEIISRFVHIKQFGTNFKGLCPFHNEKTASFSVSPQKKIFYCFGCQKGGNVIRFLMNINNLSFQESLHYLADEYNIFIKKDQKDKKSVQEYTITDAVFQINKRAVTYFTQTLKRSKAGEPAQEYLRKRGLSAIDIETFSIGFSTPSWDGLLSYLVTKTSQDKEVIHKAGLIKKRTQKTGYYDVFRGRVIFPICDIQGRVVGFGGRIISDQDKNVPKYINTPETSVYVKGKNLYGLNLSKNDIRQKRQVVVVEGYLDFIAAYKHGIKNTVATLGTALTSEQAKLIKRFAKEVVLVFDGDEAGEKAVQKGYKNLISVGGLSVKTFSLPKGSDPDSYINKFGGEKFLSEVENARSFLEFLINKTAGFIKNNGTASIEGKTQLIAKLLPLISAIPNIIEKTSYLSYLAEKVEVPHDALQKEILRISPVEKKEPIVVTKPKKDNTEYLLIQSLIHHCDEIDAMKKYINPTDFEDSQLSKIAKLLFEFEDSNLTGTNIINTLDKVDKKLSNLVSQMMMEKIEFHDVKQVIYDCLKKIRNKKLLLKKRDIMRKRKEIVKSSGSNKQEYDKLQKEYMSIKKEMLQGCCTL